MTKHSIGFIIKLYSLELNYIVTFFKGIVNRLYREAKQTFWKTIDKNECSFYTDTYKAKDSSSNGVGAPWTSLYILICINLLGGTLMRLHSRSYIKLFYILTIRLSSVSAIIPFFYTGYTDQYSYYRKVIGLLSAL